VSLSPKRIVTKASKHLATLTLRRVAKSSVLSAVSERVIVRSTLRLIRSSDIVAKFRPAHSSSDTKLADQLGATVRSMTAKQKAAYARTDTTPAKSRDNHRSNKLRSNEYDRRCSIFVSCNKCAGIHDTGISLVMQHGPVRKQSLADLYKRKVPRPLKKLSRTIVTCPWTGRQSLQTDNRRIFLVPL
jgi:hypothetical protein